MPGLWRIPEPEDMDAMVNYLDSSPYSEWATDERIWYMARAAMKRGVLAEPFPAAPTRLPVYNVRFDRDGKMVAIHNFCAPYAAKRFIDGVIGDWDHQWASSTEIELHGPQDITIRCEQLEDIMEHEDTPAEAAWQLPTPYPAYVAALRRDAPPEHRISNNPDDGPRKPQRRSSAKKPRVAKPGGLVPISDIAGSLNIEPRVARAALRKAKIEKPNHGWAWAEDEVDSIKEAIRDKLK